MRKRNHKMRPEVRQHMQRGTIEIIRPDVTAAVNQLHSDVTVGASMVKLRAALVRYLEGNADDRDHALIGGEINTCWIAAGEIEGGGLVQERLQAAGQALEEGMAIKKRHGRYGLTGPGRLALGEGVDAIELVYRATSPLQLHKAEQELQRLLRQRRAA